MVGLPSRVDVVIVGGGVVGCSIAYHLAKIGITDVLLLERKQLTCGTTWHAAGLIGQLRATRRMTELAKYTAELLRELEVETGQATGFRQHGSISVATNAERLEELKRGASMAKSFGLAVDILTPGDIKARYPLLEVADAAGGIFLHKDGQADPVGITQAFAKGARQRGAVIREGIKVERILVEQGRAVGVLTAEGEVRAATVVLAAGLWSHGLGQAIGATVPLHAAEHFYIVTEPISDLPRNLPVLRVPDECTYYKEDAGKILLGCFEPVAKPWGMSGIPEDFAFEALPEDVDHFQPILEAAIKRMPLLASAGIQTFFNGPESFTPDDRYLLGPSAEVKNLFLATGFNSIGIQSSGGAGMALAQWIRDRRPPFELIDVDCRRMQPFQANRAYLHDRTTETLGLLYAMHWPYRQYDTARGARRSPFHDRLLAAGACMGETAGWERPNWYAEPGTTPAYAYSWGRQNWFEACGREVRDVRERVGLLDLSSMAKLLVTGRDALAVLNRVSANEIDVPVGRIVYTQWLNEQAGIEADLTITRLSETSFLVITSAACQVRDRVWLEEHTPEDARCTIVDVTSGLPMLALMGPGSRALLSEISGEDLSNAGFPFGTSREIEIGYARVRASRITYVGELGWELLVPAEFALHVFERITAAGERHGLGLVGMHAMGSLRMEKGYRHWGHDIAIEDDPWSAGLGFAVRPAKSSGFIGQSRLRQLQAGGPPTRRLVQVRLADPSKLLFHEEPIWQGDRLVGSITSGMFGHAIQASLGMGYVRLDEPVTAEALAQGGFEVEVAWQRVPAILQLEPFYDPKSTRIRA